MSAHEDHTYMGWKNSELRMPVASVQPADGLPICLPIYLPTYPRRRHELAAALCEEDRDGEGARLPDARGIRRRDVDRVGPRPGRAVAARAIALQRQSTIQ